MKKSLILLSALTLSSLVGCEDRPSMFPNTDPNLQRTNEQFAADAAKRHPYKVAAPHDGDAPVRAEYDLTFQNIQLLNYGPDDINDVEMWVNQSYCVWIPNLEKGKERVKVLNFKMLYDDAGNSFHTNDGKNPIKTIELYYGGKMYNVVFKMSDF